MKPRIPRDKIAAALLRLLRPVVRQLLSWGIPYPVFDQIVRSVFVEVAEADFALPHKRQTDSRVSLITGIHRKEIARLRRLSRGRPARQPPLEENVVTRVIGRWMASPPFAARHGRARALPYESRRPREASFARLVAETGFDGPVRSVLDEMLRLGAVELRPGSEVVLVREAHVPSADLGGKLEILASDPGELFRTIVHNIEEPATPWLQRKVVYDNVGADGLPEIRAAARREGEALIRRANPLLAVHDRDRNADAPGGRRSRVVLATYYFEEPVAPANSGTSSHSSPRIPGRITSRTGVRKGPA
jgi:Family of unknown function (DUF6502)